MNVEHEVEQLQDELRRLGSRTPAGFGVSFGTLFEDERCQQVRHLRCLGRGTARPASRCEQRNVSAAVTASSPSLAFTPAAYADF